MTNPHIVSRHFLRRRARKKERELTATEKRRVIAWHMRHGRDPRALQAPPPDHTRYRVQRAKRGPFRWFVVES